MRSGKWTKFVSYVRCSNRLCSACKSDENARPHGPYTYLQRRPPLRRGSSREKVYLGRVEIDEEALAKINDAFGRPHAIKPTRKQVLDVLST